jgi:sugar-specific transcriptional regulator TrmB
MTKHVYEILQQLSFTEYEAKAYVALLASSVPLSGYAAALQSGVPRSRIYDVLSNLEERGDIIASHETPALYMPVSPQELICNRKKAAEVNFSTAEEFFSTYKRTVKVKENIWNIKGRSAIFTRMAEIIQRAQHHVFLELWPEDLPELFADLQTAANSGVKITLVSYGPVAVDFADVYEHYLLKENESGGRWAILSSDNKEALAGVVSLSENCRAAWSSHPGLVIPITQMIVHDLYLLEILKKHRSVLEESFGKDLQLLRRRFREDWLVSAEENAGDFNKK